MGAVNIKAYEATSSQLNAIKALMKALKIKFEVTKIDEMPYNPEFVAKVEKSRADYKKGDFVSVENENLKSFLGLE